MQYIINNHFYKLIGIAFLTGFVACTKPVVLTASYNTTAIPKPPNYSNDSNWSALPTKHDAADSVPLKSNEKDLQNTAQADVFFVHPTTYLNKPTQGSFEWNANIHDNSLNHATDMSTTLNQASVFNGACKVYVPRYRQAHIFAYYTKDTLARQQALELAYADVKSAFEYYLAHYHQNRPIIIAGHSQGAAHAKRLLKEFFDGKPLQKYLVFAYIIGDITFVPAQPDEFNYIKPSDSANDVGRFASWHTYLKGYYPENYERKRFKTAVCTNPLTWTREEQYADKSFNNGGIGLKFKYIPQLADAQVHDGLLWINKPYVSGRFLLRNKVWHKADINLFWQSMRDNVALRIKNYLNQ